VAGDSAWIFGGASRDDRQLGDLWRVDRETLAFERVRVTGPAPSARSASTLITDVVRGRSRSSAARGRSPVRSLAAGREAVIRGGVAPDPLPLTAEVAHIGFALDVR
jgi:hypothetical protein